MSHGSGGLQVRLLSVKRRKLRPHCPSRNHRCVLISNWFPQRDNEFTVLECSPASPELSPSELPGMCWDYWGDVDVHLKTILLLCQQE